MDSRTAPEMSYLGEVQNAKPRGFYKTSTFKQVPKHPMVIPEKPNSLLILYYSFSSNMNLVISGLPLAMIFSFYVMECYPLLTYIKYIKQTRILSGFCSENCLRSMMCSTFTVK